MNDNNETTKDILREMRCDWDAATPTVEDLAIYADRIEAAAWRERGKATAMRKALEAMLDECCNLCDVPNQMAESGHTCSWRNRWSGCQSKAIDKALAALAAPANNQDRLESPKDVNEKYIHVGDTVHMLHSGYDGDHEWDDIVLSLEYVGEGRGDDWIVYGENGSAWACECEVLKREGETDGSK